MLVLKLLDFLLIAGLTVFGVGMVFWMLMLGGRYLLVVAMVGALGWALTH